MDKDKNSVINIYEIKRKNPKRNLNEEYIFSKQIK